MAETDLHREDPWQAATWDGLEKVQLQRLARATPAERLRWLEEALLLIRAARRAKPRQTETTE